VEGLSWDGHRLVTDSGVVDPGTGRPLWTPLRGRTFVPVARPGSDDVLLFVYGPSARDEKALVLRSDGMELALPSGYL
jgi:hypothetical protein